MRNIMRLVLLAAGTVVVGFMLAVVTDHPSNPPAMASSVEARFEARPAKKPISLNPAGIMAEVEGDVCCLTFLEIVALQKKGVPVHLVGDAYGVR
jgi:hypothetical protein